MVTQPAYLRNLKAYTRERGYTDKDVAASIAEFENESDRGAIILSATGLDDCLELAILNKLPTLQADEAGRKAMFEQNGTLSTFSSRIEMAYAMGIIDRSVRKEIDLIREIRNSCAHSRRALALTVPELAAAVKASIADMIDDIKDTEPQTLRVAFILKCALLSQGVLTGDFLRGTNAILRFFAAFRDERKA